jgi:hypothetical protein
MNRCPEISRRRFLKNVLAGAALGPGLTALGADFDHLRGDRVGWARLKTPSQWWKRHAETDPVLMRFFHDNTSLSLDPIWRVADVEQFDQMCKFPLLFSQGVDTVQTETGRANIAEYIRRGGFLLIDACIDDRVTPDPDVFLSRQKELLESVLPESRMLNVPGEHAVFRCLFDIPEHKPPQTHTFYYKRDDPRWAKHGLYEVQIGARAAGVITLHGLQCGWARVGRPPPEGHDIACMRTLVNIYVYAMMQGA